MRTTKINWGNNLYVVEEAEGEITVHEGPGPGGFTDMTRATKINFGDNLTVVDEGGGVITVHAGMIPTTPTGGGSFADLVTSFSDLRGYWRLGEGGFGPYADSKPAGPWMNTPMVRYDDTVDMSDLAIGALPAGQDDGAIQFNSPTGAVNSDWLFPTVSWGSVVHNPFEIGTGTVAGWMKPLASSSTFDGGLFTMLAWAAPGQLQGYTVGLSWPTRTVYSQGAAARVNGPSLPADEWTFVCVTNDGTNCKIYLNGALVTSGVSLGWTPGTNVSPGIGRSALSVGTGSPGVFYGGIDEVAVWGSVLPATAIWDLWLSGSVT